SYEIPYIGQQATTMKYELYQKLVRDLQNDLERLNVQIDKKQNTYHLINSSRLSQILSSNKARFFKTIKQVRREFIELEEKVNNLAKNPQFTELEAQLQDERNKKRQLRLDYEKLSDKMADLRSEKTRILEQIEEARTNLDEYLAEQKELHQKYPTLINTAYQQFNALKEKYQNNFDLISRDLAQSTVAINSQNAKAENEVVNLMRAYITNYHFGAAPDISELIHFEKEANLIRDNNLMKYEQ